MMAFNLFYWISMKALKKTISIAKAIQESLAKFNIDMCKATAYSADNASMNYEVPRSVYQHLKAEPPSLLKANCCAHVVPIA